MLLLMKMMIKKEIKTGNRKPPHVRHTWNTVDLFYPERLFSPFKVFRYHIPNTSAINRKRSNRWCSLYKCINLPLYVYGGNANTRSGLLSVGCDELLTRLQAALPN